MSHGGRSHGVPTHQTPPAVRLQRRGRLEAGGAARGRGHHRPRRWATPTARRRRTSSQSLVESAQKPQNHRYSVSRGIYKLRVAICDWYQRRYGVELDPDSEAIVTIGSKEGIGHLALAMLGPGRRRLLPEPDLSHPSVLGDHRGRRPALHSAHAGRRLPRPAAGGRAHHLAEAEAADPELPGQPHDRGGRPGVLREDRRVRARARPASWCTTSRTPTSASTATRRRRSSAGAGRARRRRRVLHAVEELQHAGLARRLRGRQPRHHRTPSPASRATSTTAPSSRIQIARHRRAERTAGLRRRDPRAPIASGATCCATGSTAPAGTMPEAARPRCSSGREIPDAVQADGVARVLEAPAARGQGRGLARHRLRRVRRGLSCASR